MFTLDQISAIHSKVKSGADFPAFIREIKNLGVISYETFVLDGHTNYYGINEFKISSIAKYDTLQIAKVSNPDLFLACLRAHQKGKTDYATFCNDCAKSGIEKWTVLMDKMTCTYFDMAANEILIEQIP